MATLLERQKKGFARWIRRSGVEFVWTDSQGNRRMVRGFLDSRTYTDFAAGEVYDLTRKTATFFADDVKAIRERDVLTVNSETYRVGKQLEDTFVKTTVELVK